MARVPARIHQTGVSLTNQDGTSAEAVTTTGGGLLTHTEPRVLSMAHPQTSNDLGDSNRNTFFGQDYPQPVLHRTGQKQLGGRCDNFAAAFGAYFAGHAGAAASTAEIPTSTGIYRNTWDLGIDDLVARSFTMVELADKNNTDADLNETFLNNVLTSFSITGTRGGAITYSMNVIHGGNTAVTGSPPTIVDRAQRWYNFGKHVFLNTTDSTGYSTPTPFAAAPSKSQQVTDSYLNSSGLTGNFVDDLHAFTLTFNIEYDIPGSMTPGGNEYVPTNADWMITNQSAQLDLTFVWGSANTKALRSEYKSGTDGRAWELWLVHDSALASGAYAGFVAAFQDMAPIDNSWAESTQGGNKYVSLSYRPLDTASIVAGKMAATINSSVALGS